mmetsp:Transcript_138881/g.245126  ORF Transcript_138881/g.245126 Transcript_138881/m.245126 type:complete len:255 (+) Transcript_138881:167-931(+)
MHSFRSLCTGGKEMDTPSWLWLSAGWWGTQYHMRIGATDAKRAHTGNLARPIPCCSLSKAQRCLIPIDELIWALTIERGNQALVVEHERRFHEARDPSCCVHVSKISFYGAHQDWVGCVQCLCQSSCLKWVPKPCACAVSLNVIDIIPRNACVCVRLSNYFHLTFKRRSGEASFASTVIIGCSSQHCGIDSLIPLQSIVKMREHHQATTIRIDGAVCILGEGSAYAIRRPYHAFDMLDGVIWGKRCTTTDNVIT